MSYETEQESFWAGKFGDEYTERNKGLKKVISNVMFFSKIIARTGEIKSIVEFGANIGLNILALQQLLPSAEITALEINAHAANVLKNINGVDVKHASILDPPPLKKYDLSLIKGVLIHIAPERIPDVYHSLYHASKRFILLAEYYNPTPVEVQYRGHKGKLFKRDFAGEMIDMFPDLTLLDYGFTYHRDPFPQDDITWFLMKKKEQ